MSLEVRDLALVTHAVPPDRVLALLPGGFELETLEGRALVSTVCLSTHRLPAPPYRQVNFRTYVRRDGVPGVFFFQMQVGNPLALPGNLAVPSIRRAHVEVECRRSPEGYSNYRVLSRAGSETTAVELQAEGAGAPELARLLTHRLRGWIQARMGFLLELEIEHVMMNPRSGNLVEARLDPWLRLGALRAGEEAQAHSVLVEPRTQFKLMRPRLRNAGGPNSVRPMIP